MESLEYLKYVNQRYANTAVIVVARTDNIDIMICKYANSEVEETNGLKDPSTNIEEPKQFIIITYFGFQTIRS